MVPYQCTPCQFPASQTAPQKISVIHDSLKMSRLFSSQPHPTNISPWDGELSCTCRILQHQVTGQHNVQHATSFWHVVKNLATGQKCCHFDIGDMTKQNFAKDSWHVIYLVKTTTKIIWKNIYNNIQLIRYKKHIIYKRIKVNFQMIFWKFAYLCEDGLSMVLYPTQVLQANFVSVLDKMLQNK